MSIQQVSQIGGNYLPPPDKKKKKQKKKKRKKSKFDEMIDIEMEKINKINIIC
jgi:hypothetical protein